MSFFISGKCGICKKHKGYRLCLRIGKDICWQDCNDMRVDRRCPEECAYAVVESENLQLKTKADSMLEYTELLKKQIDRWIALPQVVFNGDIPKDIVQTEAGKKRIIEFLNNFQINSLVPLTYLKDKLSLNDLKVNDHKENYEDISRNFINFIISREWERSVELQKDSSKYEDQDFRMNYLKRISENYIFKKTNEFFLVSSALSQDKKRALVHLELNGKYDLTIVLDEIDGSWFIALKVFGKPEIVNSEIQANQQIAVLLSKNKLSDAFELLKKYSTIYVDSSDINYYWGMYYMFSNNTKKAREFLLNSVELDPDFLEAKGLYATVLLQEKEIEKAKRLYQEVIEQNPKEIKSLNNLASIYIEEGNKSEAKKLLEECLKIDPNFEYAKKNLEKL
ncbi:MAG: tetratricopeptide repeat protein [Candidatus Cloacimonadales bacterium]|nr:tetratricopeptide repeat protein [Candidatus Cloacimonadales bacterium]